MRQLATIKKIDALLPIPGADAIECAVVGGWKVVAQKGLYETGDLAVYCEIDSWIPTAVAPFLTKSGHYPKVFEGVEGERLKTIKLRGQVSQGLLLPLKKQPWVNKDAQETGDTAYFLNAPMTGEGFPPGVEILAIEGDDVSETLGIIKWEKPLPTELQGRVRGNFPHFIRKTDQERVQNLTRDFYNERGRRSWFEVTEKLDGASMTAYVGPEDTFGVCSRNLDLIETEGNAYWEAAKSQKIEEKARQIMESGMVEGCKAIAIQGELVGPGIQGNRYKLDEVAFIVFDIFDITGQKYVDPGTRKLACDRFVLAHVPILETMTLEPFDTVESVLLYADGQAVYNAKSIREGVVFKHCENPDFSFKAISNKYLLKHED